MKKKILPAENAGYLNESYHLFHLRDTAGQERDYHFHEFDKLVLLIEGAVTYTVEERSYSLQPGDLLLVRHHSIHKAQIDISQPYERVILYLNSHYFDRMMPVLDLTGCFERANAASECRLHPEKKQLGEILGIIDTYEQTKEDGDPFTRALSETYLMQLLITIGRTIHSMGIPGAKEKRVDSKISGVLSYINSHLQEDLSVEQLADQVFLSRSRFMHLFREQTGDTVHAYIRRKRLVRAVQRVREGMSAAEAAAECGFRDYSTFYRAFRSEFGISPAEMIRDNCQPQTNLLG